MPLGSGVQRAAIAVPIERSVAASAVAAPTDSTITIASTSPRVTRALCRAAPVQTASVVVGQNATARRPSISLNSAVVRSCSSPVAQSTITP